MNSSIRTIFLSLFTVLVTAAALAVRPPGVPNDRGVNNADGAPFKDTGSFQFALVDDAGTTSCWSDDDTSTTGKAAVAACDHIRPDWTIMGLRMPGLDSRPRAESSRALPRPAS